MADSLTNVDSPGARLRWARVRKGHLDAAAFARSLNIKPVTYRAYEADQNGFSKHVVLFSEALGVPGKWLLHGGAIPQSGGPHATRPPEDTLPSADELGEMIALVASHASGLLGVEGGPQEIGAVLREALAYRASNPDLPFDRTLGALGVLLQRLDADRTAPPAS